jgi:hypothetical protein
MNATLAAHLARHLGVVTRKELLAAQLTQRQIEWMVTSGELVRVHVGVYRHAATAVTFEQRVDAGILAVGATAVASHRCALSLTGARGFAADLVELTSRTTSRSRRSGMIVHRSRNLVATDVCRHGPIPMTTPARTLIDAATVMPSQFVARIAQDWLANRRLKLDDLHTCIHRVGTSIEFRRALEAVDLGGADSVPEALLGEILRVAGIPPVLHHVVTREAGEFELD